MSHLIFDIEIVAIKLTEKTLLLKTDKVTKQHDNNFSNEIVIAFWNIFCEGSFFLIGFENACLIEQ